jgi:hypothetical protein
MDRLARLLFVVGLVAIAFAYGFLARSLKLPPYLQIKQALDAGQAFVSYLADTDYLEVPIRHERAGVTVLDEQRASPGLTFISLYTGERFLARLIDLQGKVVHEWRASFREVWGGVPPHVSYAADDRIIEWHGTHLYPNGDVLFNFEGQLFPYGGGLVRVDKDSKVIWKVARNTHHSVEVAEDGTIWVAALNYRPEGMKELPGWEPWFYEDVILKISPDGVVQDEISVPLALKSLPGLLPPKADTFDPLHLNDVEPVTAELAARLPMLAAGDLLVSLRDIGAVVAIDPAAKAAKWSLVGPFRQQHDPDLLPGGRLMVFDNRGGDPACGRSRVLEIDLAALSKVWRYDGCGGDRFDSEAWGAQQVLPNGNVLITESFGGRVIEVTRETPSRIVWEYVNLIGERDGRKIGGVIGATRRVAPGELTFLEPPSAALTPGASAPSGSRADPRLAFTPAEAARAAGRDGARF